MLLLLLLSLLSVVALGTRGATDTNEDTVSLFAGGKVFPLGAFDFFSSCAEADTAAGAEDEEVGASVVAVVVVVTAVSMGTGSGTGVASHTQSN